MKNENQGFTLVEAMIALSLLAVMGLSTLGTAYYARLQAERAVYDNMALTVTLGYVEQIKNMNYSEVLAAYRDPNTPLPTLSASSIMQGLYDDLDDPIYADGNPNEKQIIIDIRNPNTAKEEIQYMDYKISITLNDLESASPSRQAIEIKIDYSYKRPMAGSFQWKTDQISFLKAKAK